ncbi:DUF695 domain-containing protein [Phyllobacterium sp. 22552]|uniref:DUF695 domain-containing protein n=1 Tax=Phyllobacterium sp. 22552 TaxID=3453941 RepID=UPI003F8566B1
MNNNRPDEKWATCLTNFRSKRASILVDLSLRTVAPMASHLQLFVVRVDIRNPREDGLFQRDEGDTLFAIGDAIVEAVVKPQNQGIQAGKLTTDGKILYYFYFPDQVILRRFGIFSRVSNADSTPATLEKRVDLVMSKFEGYKYQCFGSKEPGWEAYLDLLYPNEWEFQMISNGDLLSHMREQNDDTAQPRAIDHFIICPSQEIQMKIKASGEAMGFIVTTDRTQQTPSTSVVNTR